MTSNSEFRRTIVTQTLAVWLRHRQHRTDLPQLFRNFQHNQLWQRLQRTFPRYFNAPGARAEFDALLNEWLEERRPR